jgi:hypothetical protein
MTELTWDGKYKDGKKQGPVRIPLPFQIIETVNESAQDRRRNLELFASGRDMEWRNRLIWGDKKYVLPSLLRAPWVRQKRLAQSGRAGSVIYKTASAVGATHAPHVRPERHSHRVQHQISSQKHFQGIPTPNVGLRRRELTERRDLEGHLFSDCRLGDLRWASAAVAKMESTRRVALDVARASALICSAHATLGTGRG